MVPEKKRPPIREWLKLGESFDLTPGQKEIVVPLTIELIEIKVREGMPSGPTEVVEIKDDKGNMHRGTMHHLNYYAPGKKSPEKEGAWITFVGSYKVELVGCLENKATFRVTKSNHAIVASAWRRAM